MDNSDKTDLLDLLLATDEVINSTPKPQPLSESNEDEIFLQSINAFEKQSLSNGRIKKKTLTLNKESKSYSVIHNGDTDSSDDEGNRDFTNQKYNEFGKTIKHMLQGNDNNQVNDKSSLGRTWNAKVCVQTQPTRNVNTAETFTKDIFSDPIFGIRIVKPLVSSALLKDSMECRKAVSMFTIRKHVETVQKDTDWAFAGVIVQKSTKTSQKGNTYSLWTLSDLHGDLKTVSLLLFGTAHKELWKLTIGTVIGVLNPNIYERRANSDHEAVLSLYSNQNVMIFGQSKDFGNCKSIKKNGDKCTNFVNLNRCEYCTYHVKQEYAKCTKRSDLQSPFGGGLTALRNKVLGKNEVFYAGKSYTAIPAKKSKKLVTQDANRLNLLACGSKDSCKVNKGFKGTIRKIAPVLDISPAQKAKDLELLKKLGNSSEIGLCQKTDFGAKQSTPISLEESKSTALAIINKLKSKAATIELNQSDKSETSSNEDLSCSLKVSEIEFNSTSVKTNVKQKQSYEVRVAKSKNKELAGTNKLKSKAIFQNLELNNANGITEGFSHKSNKLSEIENDFFNDDDIENAMAKLHEDSQNQVTSLNVANVNKSSDYNNGNITGNFLSPSSNDSDKILPVNKVMPTINQKQLNCDIKNWTAKVLQNTSSASHESNQTANNFIHNPKRILSQSSNKLVDLNVFASRRQIDKAKLSAIKWVQNNGPIAKKDPNSLRGSAKKRLLNQEQVKEEQSKKQKIEQNEFFSERFKKIMGVTTSHPDLLERREDEEKEKYFNKLEAKERMEEKMLNTFKVDCKAVKCVQCKYTSFSASDICKKDRHKLVVFDAVKRFFACGQCGNRTVALTIIPTENCKNCGSGKWERAPMMKERKGLGPEVALSIRGGEQKFMNSTVANTNINLLIPDD